MNNTTKIIFALLIAVCVVLAFMTLAQKQERIIPPDEVTAEFFHSLMTRDIATAKGYCSERFLRKEFGVMDMAFSPMNWVSEEKIPSTKTIMEKLVVDEDRGKARIWFRGVDAVVLLLNFEDNEWKIDRFGSNLSLDDALRVIAIF